MSDKPNSFARVPDEASPLGDADFFNALHVFAHEAGYGCISTMKPVQVGPILGALKEKVDAHFDALSGVVAEQFAAGEVTVEEIMEAAEAVKGQSVNGVPGLRQRFQDVALLADLIRNEKPVPDDGVTDAHRHERDIYAWLTDGGQPHSED